MERLITIDQIYQAKSARRKRLAALSIDERVKIIDRLHQLCVIMREVRSQQVAQRGEIQTEP